MSLGSSFRDPSGFVFFDNGVLYRQINEVYFDNYKMLMESGLYDELTEKGLLVRHKEVNKILQPDMVPFISYPYEWSFSMLKDAALATLEIQKIALKHGMTLKDASAYNIQFVNVKPILIDTLSFEKYEEGTPWVAYQQFCRHFLAPLALMSHVNVELGKLSSVYIDGIPLDLASKLLPSRTKLNAGLLLHLHFHSKSQAKHAGDAAKATGKVSKTGLLGILDNLETTVRGLKWNLPKTEWGNYYSATNYSDRAMEEKGKQVEELILATKPKNVWDLGANTGRFSRLASKNGIPTVAFDIDPVAVEINYLACKQGGEQNLLPLLQDLTNPSADIGFSNNERDSLLKRGPVDTVLALALIHHLAISNNLPFDRIARFFARCCKTLIIEFAPKSDSQVKILLASRKDIFDHYNVEDFKLEFGKLFGIKQEKKIKGTDRTLYLMERKSTHKDD